MQAYMHAGNGYKSLLFRPEILFDCKLYCSHQKALTAVMSSDPRKGSLEVPTLQFPDQTLSNQSILSLDGFRSPSPLPGSPAGIPGDQDALYELAELIQIDGTKVAS